MLDDVMDVREQRRRDAGMLEHLSPATLGRAAIRIEISGLEALAGSLGRPFEAAVHQIMEAQGRLIVTGIGKSGHIGRKIAATLASTGTPSFFLHAAEASHGDLGMVTAKDVVIALSKSGESSELSDIVHYCRRHDVPLIAVTAQANSTLAREASHVLLIPDVPEACAIGVAPTTSTTMMLVMGDALAVALMGLRGFSHEHFRNFHPGGRLGQTLRRVAKVMHSKDALPKVHIGSQMDEVIIEMSAKGFGCAAVVDDNGLLVGAVTDGDLRRHMRPDLPQECVKNVMTTKPKVVKPDCLVGEAVAQMNSLRITTLFVVDDANRLQGLLHLHDCVRTGDL